MYDWVIPDGMLTPADSVAAFGDLVKSLPPGARVLDCACGTGQLAVGLAGLGLDVVATDASAGMVRRTDHLDAATFDMVFCVGNSLHHADGTSGRLAALAAMAQLLGRGGRLVLTSRTWELIRANGSRLDVRDRLVRRRGRDAFVVYNWQIEERWEQEHHLDIAVAQVGADGVVTTCSERLSCWPFRHEQLVSQLQRVGLRVETTTFDPVAEGYMVVAVKEDAQGGCSA
ncbi:class I SAM-dependent methyltransferase [Nocardioides koreensis]|uniref:class I SAM-dependent methyltransferase n=1 Tax=Nocardioides koreensis TaxID=433651 RepID=UPI0031D57DF4